LVGPSKDVQFSCEHEFIFIILAVPTKTKNSEQNGKHRAKWKTLSKMENGEENGKHGGNGKTTRKMEKH
jgi:hypothetical protein